MSTVGPRPGFRVWLTSAVLMLVGLALAVLASPTASAGLIEDRFAPAAPAMTSMATIPTAMPTGTPLPPGSTTPRMLASTGLDITVPVVIGLSVLVLGTLMVGWAFLATGRRSPEAGGSHR